MSIRDEAYHVLPRGMITPNERDELKRLAIYIALFHTPYFLQARLTSAAPRLDLTLWKHMCEFETIDVDIAAAVKESIKRQQWYLTQVRNSL